MGASGSSAREAMTDRLAEIVAALRLAARRLGRRARSRTFASWRPRADRESIGRDYPTPTPSGTRARRGGGDFRATSRSMSSRTASLSTIGHSQRPSG